MFDVVTARNRRQKRRSHSAATRNMSRNDATLRLRLRDEATHRQDPIARVRLHSSSRDAIDSSERAEMEATVKKSGGVTPGASADASACSEAACAAVTALGAAVPGVASRLSSSASNRRRRSEAADGDDGDADEDSPPSILSLSLSLSHQSPLSRCFAYSLTTAYAYFWVHLQDRKLERKLDRKILRTGR